MKIYYFFFPFGPLVSNCTTSVYVAGDNSIGQLGFISDFEVLSFNENPALSGTVQIASGFTHTLALLGIIQIYNIRCI